MESSVECKLSRTLIYHDMQRDVLLAAELNQKPTKVVGRCYLVAISSQRAMQY